MSKPILVIKVPTRDIERINEIQKGITAVKGLGSDYYIFIIPNSIDEYDFKVFNGEYTHDEYKKIETFIEGLKS